MKFEKLRQRCVDVTPEWWRECEDEALLRKLTGGAVASILANDSVESIVINSGGIFVYARVTRAQESDLKELADSAVFS